MLLGEYTSNIGEKNRISIPKRLRDEMVGKIYLTRGYENCLIMVDSSRWNNLIDEISRKSILNRESRDIKRFIVGGAQEIEYDAQGRFVLAESLIKFADIEQTVVFLGIGEWIEIWDSERWKNRLEKIVGETEEITKRLLTDDIREER